MATCHNTTHSITQPAHRKPVNSLTSPRPLTRKHAKAPPQSCHNMTTTTREGPTTQKSESSLIKSASHCQRRVALALKKGGVRMFLWLETRRSSPERAAHPILQTHITSCHLTPPSPIDRCHIMSVRRGVLDIPPATFDTQLCTRFDSLICAKGSSGGCSTLLQLIKKTHKQLAFECRHIR